MKKSAFMVLILALLFSCSKDDDTKITISNLSGVDWYDAQVWFANDVDGDLIDYVNVGIVAIGNSCNVRMMGPYFYIYASDAEGKLIMSKHKSVHSSTVTAKDLY